MKRVYISGKMTGIKDFNYPVFHKKEKQLRRLGYEVFNPANIQGRDDWTWQDYMRECIAAIPKCTHIYLLNGWETSRGANIELLIANTIGLTVMYEKTQTRLLEAE